MKHTFLTLLFAIVVSTGTSSSAVVGGIGYFFDSDNLTAYVTGLSVKYSGSITIPSSVSYSGKTYNVTGINSAAFQDCSDLTSITIPYSVTSIGRGAFRGCSSLTSMVVAEENIVYDSRSNCNAIIETSSNTLIAGCKNTLIPNSVTEIGNRAFEGCSSLTSIEIPNSVTSIGYWAFSGCSSLTSVTIPNSVTNIGNHAFHDCTGLTSVTIPNSVTSIEGGVFSGCSSLTTPVYNAHVFAYMPSTYSGAYSILDGIESIAGSAFSGCSNLTSINIPNSVTNIGGNAFYGCSSLPIIDNIRYADTYLIEAVDKTCKSYTIKNGTKWIGQAAFMECTNLTSITIPEGVMEIGTEAFYDCHDLASITIPNSVTKIFTETFTGCVSLFATIPNSVVEIDGASFILVPNVEYSGTATGAPWEARSVNGFVDDLLVYSDESKTQLLACSAAATGDIVIPNSVTNIGYYAFWECSSLTSVTIPNSVTSIGEWAFYNCSSLTDIYVCGDLERFQRLLNNDDRIKVGMSYSITINAEHGNVSYPQTMCDDMQLTATPYNGYHFVKWSDGNTDNPRTIELTCDTIFTALFEHNQCTISLQCDDNQGTVEGAGVFDYLAEVQISATPAYGYHFSSWSDGNTANPRTITVTKDVTLTANFAPNKYSINVSCNAEQGSVKGSGSYTYLSNRTIEATSNYGYHFKQWSDGNTDNPRTIELRQDTAFVAIFAVDKYGTCGDNLQLTWRYDTGNQTLTISGDGDLTTNMRYGVEAVKEMKKLVIEDGVGVIGNEAFANIKTLNTITLGKDVRKLQERVFYNCYNLTAIYNYRKTPASATSNTFEEVDKYACTIYVLAGSEDMFRSATGWKDFYSILAIGATETTVSDNKVSVEPSDNSATVTWPVSNEAASYTIDITKDGVVFCRLTFNANGQLTGIAFAPGRDGQSMAPAAVMTANGLQFTVTGLTSNTQYGYSITATDAENTEVASYTGTFTTTGEIATGIDAQQSDHAPRKFMRDNQVLIMREGKTYTIQGVEVK